MQVGVLALQGDFQAHERALRRLGAETVPVRTADELAASVALVIPGGESSAIHRLMEAEHLGRRITERITEGMAVLATCAGVIVLAREVEPAQQSLAVLDVDVIRNAYGRQIASEVARVGLDPVFGEPCEMNGVFIRAPKVTRLGSTVSPLGRLGDDVVLMRQQGILAATFHPELGEDLRVHRMFLEMVEERDG